MKRGDLVRIEFIRPGKEVTHFEEDFITRTQADLACAAMKRLVNETAKGIYPTRYASRLK